MQNTSYKRMSISVPTYVYDQLDEFIEPRKRSEAITSMLENYIITKRLENTGITYSLTDSNPKFKQITDNKKSNKSQSKQMGPIDAFFALNDKSISMTREEIVDMIRKDRNEH